jgi:aminomethyltransferase
MNTTDLKRTVLYDCHIESGAQMVPFGGWDMPVMYGDGILTEHLTTRKGAGMFDVSHMGRYVFRGSRALEFLQFALTNNAAALDAPDNGAQYTFIPTAAGTAVDDAYLYRFIEDEYLLVVNAGNRDKDWAHFQELLQDFNQVEMIDRSDDLAMISVQGPASRRIVEEIIEAGRLPEPARNALSTVTVAGADILLARTGYTGEPLGFELFIPAPEAARIWNRLMGKGAAPVGLGARDTLRLEAALPLYGHELGTDPDGKEIPIFACPLAKFGVSFSELKGDFFRAEKPETTAWGISKNTFQGFLIHCGPAPHDPAADTGGAWYCASGGQSVQGGPACRLCHQRHHGAVLGV